MQAVAIITQSRYGFLRIYSAWFPKQYDNECKKLIILTKTIFYELETNLRNLKIYNFSSDTIIDWKIIKDV